MIIKSARMNEKDILVVRKTLYEISEISEAVECNEKSQVLFEHFADFTINPYCYDDNHDGLSFFPNFHQSALVKGISCDGEVQTIDFTFESDNERNRILKLSNMIAEFPNNWKALVTPQFLVNLKRCICEGSEKKAICAVDLFRSMYNFCVASTMFIYYYGKELNERNHFCAYTTEIGFPAVFIPILYTSSSIDLLTSILSIICNMIHDELISREFVSPLISVIARNVSPEVTSCALEILWYMSRRKEIRQEMILPDIQLLPILVANIQTANISDWKQGNANEEVCDKLLFNFDKSSSQRQLFALKVLSNLSDEESNYALFTSRETGLLSCLVDIVENDAFKWDPNQSSDDSIVRNIEIALNQFHYSSPAVNRLMTENNDNYDGGGESREQALAILLNLAIHPDNQLLFITDSLRLLEVCNNLYERMLSHGKDELILCLTAKLLSNLANDGTGAVAKKVLLIVDCLTK